ncbi:hypothetical protein AA11826_0599 [Komagataeibacter oboediens DSM 11826]|nr:hypothetical protein AA11826_0599 [Komagataeibacter oboediens DSM 11826]
MGNGHKEVGCTNLYCERIEAGQKSWSGSFFLTRTDAPYLMRWKADPDCPFKVLHLYLGRTLVNRAA